MEQTVDTSETTSVQDDKVERNYEAEASKMGWQPEEKFKGDKSKWVDAKSFVERGEEVLPIVKAELRKTREELAEFRKTADEFAAFNKAAHEREKREWETKLREATQAKKEAITQGDGDKVIEAEATIDTLKANRPEPQKEVQKLDPEFKSWLDENEWYGKDKTRTMQANVIGLSLAEGGLRGRALYDAVSEKLVEFDQKESGTTRTGPQRGGKVAAATKGQRTYENLKQEAKEQCDRQYKYFGGKGTEEAWRKTWTSRADDELFRS